MFLLHKVVNSACEIFKLVNRVKLSSWLMMIFGFWSLLLNYKNCRILSYNNVMRYNINNDICI